MRLIPEQITRHVARELHAKSSSRNNFDNRVCTGESGIDPVELVGYGPTMWVESRKGGDILHGHDSKAC